MNNTEYREKERKEHEKLNKKPCLCKTCANCIDVQFCTMYDEPNGDCMNIEGREIIVCNSYEKEEKRKCPECGSTNLKEEVLGECHGHVARTLVCYNCGSNIEPLP